MSLKSVTLDSLIAQLLYNVTKLGGTLTNENVNDASNVNQKKFSKLMVKPLADDKALNNGLSTTSSLKTTSNDFYSTSKSEVRLESKLDGIIELRIRSLLEFVENDIDMITADNEEVQEIGQVKLLLSKIKEELTKACPEGAKTKAQTDTNSDSVLKSLPFVLRPIKKSKA